LKQRNLFGEIFLTKNIFYEVILVFDP